MCVTAVQDGGKRAAYALKLPLVDGIARGGTAAGRYDLARLLRARVALDEVAHGAATRDVDVAPGCRERRANDGVPVHLDTKRQPGDAHG